MSNAELETSDRPASHSSFALRNSSFSTLRIARDFAILACLVILSHLAFLARPFHIDDRIYLEISRQVGRTPLYPMDYAPLFEGKHAPDAASHTHPPLISYLLALLQKVGGGEREVPFHAVFLIFPVLLACGAYLLALNQMQFPLLTALLVAWNPAVYVLSQSIMTDVPFLALYTLAIALFISGQEWKRDLRWPAAVVLVLAALVNYLALTAIPLLFAVQWKRAQRRLATQHAREHGKNQHAALLLEIWPLIFLPTLTFIGWVGLQSYHHHRFILLATGQFLTHEGQSQWLRFGQKLLSTLLNMGSMLLVMSLFGLRRGMQWMVWFALTFAGAAATALLAHWHWIHCALLGLFLASGIVAIKDCFTRGDATRYAPDGTNLHLYLWLLGFLAACIFVFYHGSVRYTLPALVPAVILLLKKSVWGRWRALSCAAVTLAYAVLLAHADHQFASIYPRIAKQVFETYPAQRVWDAGEWGFRYYMEQRGGQTISREDRRPDKGDILVKPYLAMPYVTGYDDDEHVDLLHREFVSPANPIRLLDFSTHAGFYSTGWGILPWSIDVEHKPVEIFNFFQVKKRFAGNPSRLREDYFR